MKIICISAKAQHGKDTAAAILKNHVEANGKKAIIIHYADLLKFICKQFFGWDGNKDEQGRTILQYIGTDVVGTKKPEYWAEWVVSFLKLFEDEWDYVFIPDCRYPVEIDVTGSAFQTWLIRVVRPNFENGLTTEQQQHPSETAMDNYLFDVTILNDGDLELFTARLTCWFDYTFCE